jgi:hypothetical protein
MASGGIFTLMINDGKQNTLLNATSKLQERIDNIYTTRMKNCMSEMKSYFNNPANYGKPKFQSEKEKWKANPVEYCLENKQAAHQTLMEISKTHKIYIGKCYKPFVAMAYSYLKINEKEGNQTFGNDITFTIPQNGTWIGDMVLHIKLNGLRAASAQDKVKYCALLGHRLVEKVEFMINNTTITEYTSEMYNKYFQFHVPSNKKQGWLRNIGQEIPVLAYMTPDPKNNEFREYKWFGDGPQTFKYKHDEVDMYIPLLFWFNLDIAQAFPNVKISKGNVKIRVTLSKINKLVAVANYGGEGKYHLPQITTADLYVNHISTLPEIENIMLWDYDFSLIHINKTFERILNHSDGEVHLKELKFLVEHMAVSFRPLANLNDVDNWYRSTCLTPVDLFVPAAIMDYTQMPAQPILAINVATYYSESQVVDSCGLKIKNIDIFQTDTVKKYSSFYPFAATGLNTPDDQGWLLLNNQFRPDIYDPSGHIDMSRNRDVYLNYSSSWINDSNRVKLIVIAQSINFLIVNKNSAYLRYI